MSANVIERYPKAVALSLLLLLLAGGTAGGLWVRNLRMTIHHQEDALAAREAEAKEDRQSLEERHNREVALLRKENAYLSDQVTILRRTARDLSASLAKVTSILNESSGSPASGATREALSQAVGELERQSDDMSHTIEKIDTGEPRPAERETEAAPAGPAEGDPRPGSLIPLGIAAAAVSLGLLGFAVYLYRKNQDLERKEIRLNQREQRIKMMGPRPGAVAGQG